LGVKTAEAGMEGAAVGGGVVLWALIFEGITIYLKKIVAGPRVSVSSQNKKIAVACMSNPVANNGDSCSLTIVPNDTGPCVSVSRQTVRGLLKISHQY
jgi:hypothetical protein